MFTTVFYIIIAILIFDFLLERLLNYLNSTRWSNELPKELHGIYDVDQYKKSQGYYFENQKLGLITSILTFLILLLMLFFGGFSMVDGWARLLSGNSIFIALLFFMILGFAMDILSTPFSLYDTFVIEEKYGFNKTTLKTFFLDKKKGWFLAKSRRCI